MHPPLVTRTTAAITTTSPVNRGGVEATQFFFSGLFSNGDC